jgi:hypothetical protein
LVALAGASGLSQVKVNARLDQPSYLEGEPVFVIVDVTNTGDEPIGYSECDARVELSVPGASPKNPPNLYGCYTSAQSGSGCGIDHPPLMKPGQTVSFYYLLKGYHLRAGEYTVHASGEAGVRWFFGEGRNSSAVSGRTLRDIVEGRKFEASLPIRIRQGTSDELKQRYLPYVQDAENWSGLTAESLRARRAIAEMAPSFLERTILGFAGQPETADLAVEGLSQIPTDQSRADLIELYDKSSDLRLRRSIAEGLAGIATRKELPFFVSLLPGHSSMLEDQIRVFAVLGIGKSGGDEAVLALVSAQASPNPEVRVVHALGNTRSRAAVPVLIDMYATEEIRNDVCWALSNLTHYIWCHGAGTVPETQAKWKKWWKNHGANALLYGLDQCVPMGALVPLGE